MDTIPSIKNLGRTRWKGTWVSKSDVVEFLRCPYRIFIAHSQNIHMAQLKRPELIKSLLQKGSKFEESIINQMPFQEVENIESVLDEEVILSAPLLIQNNKRGIRGIVDLIDVERGRLYPIEIKNHRDLQDSDRLELAFYWRLLEPLRKGKPKPKGYVLLNTGEITEVLLTKGDFEELDSIVVKIRLVKEYGTVPAICGECKFCLLKDECEVLVIERGGLTLVSGIGHIRQRQLESLGVRDLSILAAYDTEALHLAWYQNCSYAPGLQQVRVMQIHAQSWVRRAPICFNDEPFPIGRGFAILDLEYETSQFIYLVGLIIVNGKDRKYHQFFAEHPKQEKQVLVELVQILNENPKLTLVTWFGTSADMPQLRQAWRRQKLSLHKLDNIGKGHVDLGTYLKRNFRLPTKSFQLDDIERYFGYSRQDRDINGLLALTLYNEHLTLKNKRMKQEIRTRLLNYNREDLEATRLILDQSRSLANR